ncbi:MAG TPA: tetratricopeptide repeat protein [Woeseiaceae bacterium]|nr:tetratricopeptide repeat protein [Woeseiaceae bacterium]
MSGRIDALLAMLRAGRDSALLRFSLGSEYRAAGRDAEAVEHFEHAVRLDPDYSAAWKLLGRSLEATGRDAEAAGAWQRGIEAAERKGDRQAAKEMAVFLRRLEKRRGD